MFVVDFVLLTTILICSLTFTIVFSSISPLVQLILISPWFLFKKSKTTICSLYVHVILLLTFFYYTYHGSTASSSDWGLRVANSMQGLSSCTNSFFTSEIPYNQNGFSAYINKEEVYKAFMLCHYEEVRWADNTGEGFKGTDIHHMFETDSECTSGCNFASLRKRDYQTNLGKGLTHGWYQMAPVTDTSLCPGLLLEMNEYGYMGKGDHVCSICGDGKQNPKCKSGKNNKLLCFTCPDVGSYGLRVMSIYTLVLLIIIFINTITTIVYNVSKHCKKKRSETQYSQINEQKI